MDQGCSYNASESRIPEKLLGKPFGRECLTAVWEEIKAANPFNRAEIARRVCRRLDWKSPGGRYQFMSARVAILRLHRAGLVELPPPTRGNGNGGGLRPSGVSLPKLRPVCLPVHKLKGLTLQLVEGRQTSTLYNALMQHYHYLDYSPMA